MRAILVSSTVFGTIVVAMAFGVMLGYTVILGILRVFGRRRGSSSRTGTSTAKLVALGASGR